MAVSVTILLLSSVIFIAIVYYFFFQLKRIPLYIATAKFPGPWTLPIIGNAHLFLGKADDTLDKAINLLNNYPSPFRVWMAHRLFYGVYEPEQIKIIMNSPKTLDKDDMYKFTEPFVGTSLFSAPANKWKVHRKMISPTFNQRILDSFFDVFVNQSLIMVKGLEKEVDGKEIDIIDPILLCTMDILCETALGVPSKLQTIKDSPYVESTKMIIEIIVSRVFKVWYQSDLIFYNSAAGKEMLHHLNVAFDFADETLEKKRELMAKAKEAESETDNSSDNEMLKRPFLEYLIKLTEEGKKFTEEELKEEVNLMIFAGSDTTASTIAFVMLMLGSHPEIQEKVYEELYEIYGLEDIETAPVKLQDLNRMDYLERAIKESMRLFPVGPIILRRTADDLDIGGGFTLTKGASVAMAIIKTHRSEKYWKDPLTYDPDRFLPEECAKRHPYSYVPFSGGPRNCLGLKFAMMSMKALMATFLRAYVIKKDNVTPVKDIKLKVDLLLKPQKPITVRLERRVPLKSK